MKKNSVFGCLFGWLAIMALVAAPGFAKPPPRISRTEPDADPEQASAKLQQLLGRYLPPDWTVSEPMPVMDIPQVVISIPDRWRGSPISAAMAVCPDADNAAWQSPVLRDAREIHLVVHYHGRDWPFYDCRP